jgi:hypothetical protein
MVAIAVIVSSCAKNSEAINSPVVCSEDFTAIVADNTRTTLDGTSVKWSSTDLLTVFTNTAHNRKYSIKSINSDNTSAVFKYESYTGSDDTPINANYAVYPYNERATISGDVITTSIAAEQVYNAECVDLSNAVLAAKSNDNNFAFNNTSALVRFKVSKNIPEACTLQSITLTSAANKLAGEVIIDTATDFKAVVTANGTNEVTLVVNTEITEAEQMFYVVLPATNFADKDLTVTFAFAEANKEFQLPAFDLQQGKIKTIVYQIDAEDFTGNTPSMPADNQIWYTSTDNAKVNISATDNNTYSNGKGVITFDTDLSEIPQNMFKGSLTLSSVTLPKSIITIGKYAFQGCSALSSVTMQDGVTKINGYAFKGCAFTEITLPSTLTSIDNQAFASCKFTTITIPNSVTTLGPNVFQMCNNLTSVTISDNLKSVDPGLFYSCKKLAEINGALASSDKRCLVHMGKIIAFAPAGLTEYTIPEGVTEIGSQALAWSSLKKVTISESVTEIETNAFQFSTSLSEVYCKSTTPATLGTGAFDTNATGRKIYVPSESVDAYKAAANWSAYASAIVGYDFENGVVVE